METQKTAIRLLRLLPLLFHFLSAENEFPHSMAAPASGATGSRQSKNPALWVCLLPNLLTMAGLALAVIIPKYPPCPITKLL